MEETEERINELEERTIEITPSEQQRENRLKKINRALGTSGTITKDLAMCQTSPERKKKKYGAELFEEINSWKFPKFVKRYNPIDSRSLENKDKPIEIHIKTNHSQTSENQR